jgi:DNA-binding transcriptional regulator YbjK
MSDSQLYNIVRTHNGQRTVVHGMARRPKAELEPMLRNLKRRARDARTNVYFDLEPAEAPAEQPT